MPTSFHMSVYCFYPLMPTGLFVLTQRFPRQGIEDGSDPSATWGPDRTEADAKDPDDDDNVPIPIAVPGPATGKTRASSLRDWSEDEDDDCQILEVHDAPPVAFAYPARSPPADSDDQVHDVDPPVVGANKGQTRKCPVAAPTAAGTSSAAGPTKKKQRTKSIVKHRERPVTKE